MEVYLDFGKTIAITHDGKIICYNDGAYVVMQKLLDAGHKLILNTLRIGYPDPADFNLAVEFLNRGGWEIGKNLELTSKKIACKKFDLDDEVIYIDDKAEGIPLKRSHGVLVVDWFMVGLQLCDKGILYKQEKQRVS